MAFKTSATTTTNTVTEKASMKGTKPAYQLRLVDESGSSYISLFRRETQTGKNIGSPFYVGNASIRKEDGSYENTEESFFFMPRGTGGELKFRQAKGADLVTLCELKASDKNDGSFYGSTSTGLKAYADTWEAAQAFRAASKAKKAAEGV